MTDNTFLIAFTPPLVADSMSSLRESPARRLRWRGLRKHALHDLKIPFVAGKLVNLVDGLLEAKHRRPRLGPRSWVINRYLVTDLVRGDTSESFYQMQVFRRSYEIILRRKVRSIDDQSFAFTTAARVPIPRRHAQWKMRMPIQWNDPGIVDGFHDRVTRTLHNLVVAGV